MTADPPRIGWEFPYAARRMPVLARNVVATSQPLAAQAGLEMLRRGGTAVDAALAAAIALTVVEPTSNGIGGDAFALVWDGDRLQGLNASGRSPAAVDADRYLGRDAMPFRGWDAVTVPGAVSAWVALSERFGALEFETLFEPAVRYAADGWLVSPVTATAWARAERAYTDYPEFAAAFLPGGRAPRAGERFALPDQARTLETIAASRGADFYRGALAGRIARHAANGGGALTAADLAAHRADWVTPIATEFHGWRVHEIPPNSQGLAALLTLGILARTPVADSPPDSADSLHWQIEAVKLALADAHRHIADPGCMEVDVANLLDDGYLTSRAAMIDPARAGDPAHGEPRSGGTVYLAAADAQGRMVSYIQSNYAGFGCGVVVPGTGIALQNRGAAFSTEPGHPNQIAPGKRPFHTIIPAFATYQGDPVLAFGVMGGAMQPQGHAQVVVRMAVHGQNPQAASDAPRWRVERGLDVAVEAGFDGNVLDDLAARGHRLAPEQPGLSGAAFGFGGAQLVHRLDDGWLAASDHRKDGHAVGF